MCLVFGTFCNLSSVTSYSRSALFSHIRVMLSNVEHYNGCFILQYYDLYKTEELPNLEGSNFSPKVTSFAFIVLYHKMPLSSVSAIYSGSML